MFRRFSLFFLLGLSAVATQGQAASEAPPLIPGQPVEREIAGEESHTYKIALQAGQFMRAVVEQKGIDVEIKIEGPDGKQLIEMNLTGVGETESLSLEAAAPGSYLLIVRGGGAAILRGSYRLKAEVQAAATTQDRKHLASEALLIEAKELEPRGEKTAQQVIDKLDQALVIYLEVKDRRGEGVALHNLGRTYYSLGRYDKAIEYDERALAIRRELKDRAGEGVSMQSLGLTYLTMRRFEKVFEYYEQALAIKREMKDREAEGWVLHDLGVAYGFLSRAEEAIASREQALAVFREVKDRLGEAIVLEGLGQGHMSLSHYEKAIEFYEQGLAIRRAEKHRVEEGYTLTLLGGAYGALGRYEKAIEYSEQALAISRETKTRWAEGRTLYDLGSLNARQGSNEKAIEYLEQALPITRETKDRIVEGYTLSSLGSAYFKEGRSEEAIAQYEQALAIYREVKRRPQEGSTLNSLGGVHRSLGQYDKAINYSEQALTISREVKNPEYELSALSSLARTESERGDLTRARSHIEEGLRVAESLRSEIISPASRASFLASVQSSYRLYGDLLMRQHKTEPTKGLEALAFEVSERQRARSLLDLLAEAGTDLRQGVDAALIERESSLGKQLNEKAKLLTQADKPEQSAALKLEISQLETDYERAQAAIRKASPNYAALTQPQPVKLGEIQAQLDDDTLLLEYSLGGQGQDPSYMWAIARDSLTSYELPRTELIEKNARQVYELLTARSTGKPGETPIQRQQRISQAEVKLPVAASELSKAILAPVATRLGNKRLIIVADGALQYIPFAMLPDPAAGNIQPLIVGHEVVSLPSASTLLFQRTELAGRSSAPKTLAVIADPVFDRSDVRFKSSAAAPEDKTAKETGADSRSLEHIADASGTGGRLVIRRLAFTRQEADALLALAPKASSLRETDFQANRTNVMNGDLSQYRYVHFATHGLLDSERPGLSALVLSTVDENGKAQDGFLRANDIYNMKLPAELVVLSACQTGLGKEVKGEGLIGLTRGFMYAGAKRVVVSLWSVNDRATSHLMTTFYRGMLKNNERPAAALRAAQIKMWKQKKWQSPYFWAAFTMQGEWK